MKKLLAIVTLSLATLVAHAASVTLQGDLGTYTLPEELKQLASYSGEGHAIFCVEEGNHTGDHGVGKLFNCTSRVPNVVNVMWSCIQDATGEWESTCTHNGQTDIVGYIFDVGYYILPDVATLRWDDGNILAVIAPEHLTWDPMTNDAQDSTTAPIMSYAAIQERAANLPYPTFNGLWCETDRSVCEADVNEGTQYAEHEIQSGMSPIPHFWRNRDGKQLPYEIPGGMYCEDGICYDQYDNIVGVNF